MYGQRNLQLGTDLDVDGLESAWVDTITVEGGDQSRTFGFDLAWTAAGDPTTYVLPNGPDGSAGRYVAAALTGVVTDSEGVVSMSDLDRAELSEVVVRLA